MTLDEAIKTSEYIVKAETIVFLPSHYEAVQLLIEAGKRIKLWRQDNVYPDYALLPGETEE